MIYVSALLDHKKDFWLQWDLLSGEWVKAQGRQGQTRNKPQILRREKLAFEKHNLQKWFNF